MQKHFDIKYKVFTFALMISTTTLRLDDEVKKAAAKTAKDKQVRGGLSGLVDILLREFLKKEKVIIENGISKSDNK